MEEEPKVVSNNDQPIEHEIRENVAIMRVSNVASGACICHHNYVSGHHGAVRGEAQQTDGVCVPRDRGEPRCLYFSNFSSDFWLIFGKL